MIRNYLLLLDAVEMLKSHYYFTSKNIKTVIKSYLSIFLYFYFLRNIKKPHLKCLLLGLKAFQESCEHILQSQAEITGHFSFLIPSMAREQSHVHVILQAMLSSLWTEFRSYSRQNSIKSLLYTSTLFLLSSLCPPNWRQPP